MNIIDESFSLIDRVSFELSNRCNMSHLHLKCPAHKRRENPTKNLPSHIIFKVMKELSTINFNGRIAFHQYNEPLIDPRLFWILEKVKHLCPNAKTMIWSNGLSLDQSLLDDLENIGLFNLILTAYTKEDGKRFRDLKSKSVKIDIFNEGWASILDIYDREPKAYSSPCFAPLTDLIINKNGKIGLCCRDWDGRYTLGDLNTKTLAEIFETGEILNLYNELSTGKRRLDICNRCGTYRSWQGKDLGRMPEVYSGGKTCPNDDQHDNFIII